MVKIPLEERQLNEEQKKAVTYGEGPLLIIAGAGTGKTMATWIRTILID